MQKKNKKNHCILPKHFQAPINADRFSGVKDKSEMSRGCILDVMSIKDT